MRLIFGAFFFEFSVFFVQNGWLLSKGCEQRKKFFEFFLFWGFEKQQFFAYWRRKAQNIFRERRLWMPWARTMPFPSAAFQYKKEAIHHRFGCSYHRTTYTRSIKNWHWRVKNRQITTRAAHLRCQSHRWKLHRMQYSDVCLTQICTVGVRSNTLQDKGFEASMQRM